MSQKIFVPQLSYSKMSVLVNIQMNSTYEFKPNVNKEGGNLVQGRSPHEND